MSLDKVERKDIGKIGVKIPTGPKLFSGHEAFLYEIGSQKILPAKLIDLHLRVDAPITATVEIYIDEINT